MPPQTVVFSLPVHRFGLKRGIDFAHFGLESGMVFKGTMGVHELIYCFNSKMSEKEREICEFEMDFKKSFLLLFLPK